MAINRVEIKDFLVFKGEFSMDFSPMVNVLIGANGTGKTTLLKTMYGVLNGKVANCFYSPVIKKSIGFCNGIIRIVIDNDSIAEFRQDVFNEDLGSSVHPLTGKIKTSRAGMSSFVREWSAKENASVFIPEKDMLSHSFGLLALKHERPSIPFDDTLTDIVAKAQLYPKKEMFDNPLCSKIRAIIGGEVAYDNDTFIILKDNNSAQVPFSVEASGYRKLGLLWKLLRNGLLEPGTILFWDEPENSLSPEIIPVLVDVLLELSRNSVQVFVATHSELLASYFAVNREKGDVVLFASLYKDGEQIMRDVSDRFEFLEPNYLTAEPVRLYKKEIERGLGGNV